MSKILSPQVVPWDIEAGVQSWGVAYKTDIGWSAFHIGSHTQAEQALFEPGTELRQVSHTVPIKAPPVGARLRRFKVISSTE